jgi:hypothetical protein
MISGEFAPYENVHNFAVIRPSKQVHLSLDSEVFVVDARKLYEASRIKLYFDHWWSDAAADLNLIARVDYFQEGLHSSDENDHSWTFHLKLYTAYAIYYLMPEQNRVEAELTLKRANPSCADFFSKLNR